MKVCAKIKTIREIETKRGIITGQADLAGKLDISLTTLKNYESGRTQPSFDFMMKFCQVLQLNANIFQDENLFKIYSRRKVIKDNVLLRKGLCYVFAGLGIDVVLTNKQLDDIGENKSLMHYFKFLNPSVPYGIKRRMPFVESIVSTIDAVQESLEESRNLLPQVGNKLKRTMILSKEIEKITAKGHSTGICGLLAKTKNFTEYTDEDVKSLVEKTSKAIVGTQSFENLDLHGERICKNLRDLDERFISLGDTLSDAKATHLQQFKQIYLKIDEENKKEEVSL